MISAGTLYPRLIGQLDAAGHPHRASATDESVEVAREQFLTNGHRSGW